MFGGSDLRASGAVKTGVALEGKDRESSIAAGGDGMAAEFSGGFLTATNFPGTLLKDCPEFTLSLRMKSREGPISGTVMVQRGTMKPGSGAFDVSGWHMPFMKRNHLGFHGMITDGLEPNMGNSQFSTVNMSLPSDTGWHDVVVVREKGGPLNLYFDGKLIQSRKGSSWMPGNKLPFEGAESALIFGALPDGTASFRGWIDHAAFWDRALTPAELARLGITETPAPAMKPPLATVGSGIFPDTTPMPERYDWLDAEMPAFRAQLQKNDPHLPRYHIALPGEQWNPIAFYHKGRYHLFLGWTAGGCFRYFNDSFENIIWQHLVSDDLITWTILPLPIRHPSAPNENGTFFVNDQGEAVVLYYGDYGHHWRPRMAVSRDPDLVKWEYRQEKLTVNGVPPELRRRNDPSAVFKRGDRWFMAATTVRPDAKEGVLPLYRAKNSGLTDWDYAGAFFKDPDGNPVNECGQLFPLDGRWVFSTIHKLSKKGTAMTGQLQDDGTFKADWFGITDFGSPSYDCVSTAVNSAGRAVLWRWFPVVRSFVQSSQAGWWNAYSMPRDLRLDEKGRMLVRPAAAMEKLRGKQVPLEQLKAASSEIQLRFKAEAAGESGLRLTDGKSSILAFYDHAKQESVLDFTGLDPKLTSRRDVYRATVTIKPGEQVTLCFFSDRSIFELYANDEVVISQAGFFADPENLKAELLQRGGAAAEVAVEAWEMNSLKWEQP